MAQVPTPPASRHSSEAPEVQQKEAQGVDNSAELLQTLDTLLERYLCLLDRHQKLQADLAKRLSSGFLSLARANCACPPGRRYGADYYDERMKATRKVSLHMPSSSTDESVSNTKPNHTSHTFTIESTPSQRPDKQEQEEKEENEAPGDSLSNAGSSPEHNPNSSETNQNTTQATDSSSVAEHPETDSTASLKPKHPQKKFHSSNPITWYGILVPPSLRSAQNSFTEAVDDALPELASVVVEMQAVEKEVGKVRSQLESA